MISLVLLLLVCFGCSNPVNVDYVHTVNDVDVYYTETIKPDEVIDVVNELVKYSDNFVLQTDFGIVEVEDGEIIYNNVK